MRRLCSPTLLVAATCSMLPIGLLFGASAAAAPLPPPLPPPVPVPALPPIADPNAVSTRLVTVPTGCASPPPEQAVFIGTMVLGDTSTARFAIQAVRSGSVTGFEVGGLIDVRYDDEVRFLDVDTTYIVSAGIDPVTGVLASKVRAPAPLFGGNEIAGVGNSDVECPRLSDPVRTLMVDGTSVESGVLAPMRNAEGDILRALLQPLGVAFLVLVSLVAVKHLIFAMGRSLRDMGGDDRTPRGRRHSRRDADWAEP